MKRVLLLVGLFLVLGGQFAYATPETDTEDEKSSFSIPPFYWSRKTKEEKSTLLLPFYHNYKGKEGRSFHLWPLIGYDRRSPEYNETLDAAFVHRERPVIPRFSQMLSYIRGGADTRTRYSFIYPFFSFAEHENDGVSLDLPWPVVGLRLGSRRSGAHIFPLLFYDRQQDSHCNITLFPLFWHRYRDSKNRTTLLLPFYWDIRWDREGERGTTFHLWPLFGRTKSATAAGEQYHRLMLGYPLFSYIRRGEKDKQIDVLMYLFRLRTAPGRLDLWLFPLGFGYDRQNAHKYFELFPIFLHARSNTGFAFRIWPYYHTHNFDPKGRESIYTLAFPLFYFRKDRHNCLTDMQIPYFIPIIRFHSQKAEFILFEGQKEGIVTEFYIFPLISYRTAPDRFHIAFLPLFQYSCDIDPNKRKYKRLYLIWPLFKYHSTPNSTGYSVLSLLATYENNRKLHKKDFRLLYKLFHWRSSQEEYLLQFNPLFQYRSVRGGNYDFRILLGLYGFGKEKGNSYHRLLWFLKI